MNLRSLFILFIPFVLGDNEEHIRFLATKVTSTESVATSDDDDLKCSLPDVASEDHYLDIAKLRADFSRISEVKFPGLIGPLNERLICKIKCIDGSWVGPLCASTADGRFQPILRECLLKNDNSLLLFSHDNSTVEDEERWFPHGAVVWARCRRWGLHKMQGGGELRCANGAWEGRAPACVPTTLLTNFTDDAPPAVEWRASSGAAVVGAAGELLVQLDSALKLVCVSLRHLGEPVWSAPGAGPAAAAAWAVDQPDRYELSLGRVSARHSGNYTCAAPTGHTHTVTLRVANVTCGPLSDGRGVRVFVQGSKLGHTAHYSCAAGHHLVGPAARTCMGDGRWSGRAPTCERTACPPLGALPPHLELVELNTSAGGRAVFACAWGHRMSGAPGLECSDIGQWSGPVPTCTAIYCGAVAAPEGGRLVAGARTEGRYPAGALVVFACESPRRLAGERSLLCTEVGFWSHPPPRCDHVAAAALPAPAAPHTAIIIGNDTLMPLSEDDDQLE